MITIDQFIEHYKPDKVILFGSRAGDHYDESSDWDLLIIKATDTPRLYRRGDALYDYLNVPADLIILTPKEVDYLIEAGSSFIKSILKNGKVIYEK